VPRARVYLDLDHTLLYTSPVGSVPRPRLKDFLHRLAGLYDVYLLTAADLGYARRLLDAFGVVHLFRELYSSRELSPGSITPPGRWVLVDDLDPTHANALYKLQCLGLQGGAERSQEFVDRHYIKANRFFGEPHDDELLGILDVVRSRLRSQVSRRLG
jgi:hypothetical protein